jgi:hypothetical protein
VISKILINFHSKAKSEEDVITLLNSNSMKREHAHSMAFRNQARKVSVNGLPAAPALQKFGGEGLYP